MGEDGEQPNTDRVQLNDMNIENVKYRSVNTSRNVNSLKHPISLMNHHTETPRDNYSYTSNNSSKVSTEEAAAPKTKDKVFSKLFQDEQNQFCFDCGK